MKPNAVPAALALCLLLLAVATASLPARAQDASATAVLAEQVRSLALKSSQPAAGLRVEVEAGALDPRLKLAPCQQIEPYLPTGFKPWGRTRVGLRCLQGEKKWNVYLPITVKVYGRALVAASALPAGTVLTAADLREAEIDLAADPAAALTDPQEAIGRSLLRMVSAGEDLRQNLLRARQWFAAGETVQLVAVGPGFSVQSEGQAITPGLDGSPVRVRTESGRIVTGLPVGERRVELRL